MTIQDWGAIGEIVGAFAVVATLGYLASQIRYARLAASDASRQGRANGVREMLLAVLTSPDYRHAWAKADRDGEPRLRALAERLGVTQDEANLVWNGCCAWTYLHWAQFRSMKTPADERELENIVGAFYSITPMSTVWNHDPLIKAMLDPGFVAWVDEVLTRPRQE